MRTAKRQRIGAGESLELWTRIFRPYAQLEDNWLWTCQDLETIPGCVKFSVAGRYPE